MKKLISLRGLHGRMLFWIGGSVTLGLAALILFVGLRSTAIVEAESVRAAEATSREVASEVSGYLDRGSILARTVASTIVTSIQEKRADRQLVNGLLQRALETNPELLGVWACFEPNAFDGKDADNANKPGSDEEGRFSPYWSRAGGPLALEACPEYWEKDYYQLPLEKGTPVMLEPYLEKVAGKSLLMSSFAIPLVHEGRVIGVMGVDYDLAQVAKFTNNLGIGYAAVVSQEGLYVAHPKQERLAAKFVEHDTWAKDFVGRMKEGKAFTTLSYSKTLQVNSYRIASPIPIHGTDAIWTVVVSLIQDEVLAPMHRLRWIIGGIGISVVACVLAILLFLANRIASPIRTLAAELNEGSIQIRSAASQVTAASQTLAAGSSQQAASLEESSASLEELSSMAKHNADNARKACAFSAQASKAADSGVADVNRMRSAMDEIKRSSDEISKIIQTIDSIAFQTNILALNAAVEAARAGEAGAGFAVVAEEVRSLAHRAASAARETYEKIEGSIQRTNHGVQISGKLSESLQEIASQIHQVDALVAEVSKASGEQTNGIEQLNTAVIQMDKVTQTNAASAEETASAAEELNGQAEFLGQAVTRLHAIIQGGAEDTTDSLSPGAAR